MKPRRPTLLSASVSASARHRVPAFIFYHRQFVLFFFPNIPAQSLAMIWSVLLALTLTSCVHSMEETCLSVEEDPYLYFGTKTAYLNAIRGLPISKAHDVPGCEPIAFWSMHREPTHNPDADEIQSLQELINIKNNILSNYQAGAFRDTNSRICSSDLSLLERWQWQERHNATFAGELTSDGYMTTQQQAQAFRQKYPGLLTLNTYNYAFKYGSDKRSKDTFRAFTEGLFGAEAGGFDIHKEVDDKLVKPYKDCPAWTSNVEENNETLYQRHIFETKIEYREMITNISHRFGFKYDLNRDTINRMYQMCRYNKAWDLTQISPWCAAFTREDLKRLEYAEDLEAYYKYGYGSPLYKKIGCVPIKDMITFFGNHISKALPQLPLSMVSITDAPMILTTLASLNTHQDSIPPTGDNYSFRSNVQARRWTTSTMAPYSANIAAVLYKCSPNGNFQVNDQNQVLFLENETPMYIEGCRVGLCDWGLVKTRFAELVGNCDREFCNEGSRIKIGVLFIVAGFLVNWLSL